VNQSEKTVFSRIVKPLVATLALALTLSVAAPQKADAAMMLGARSGGGLIGPMICLLLLPLCLLDQPVAGAATISGQDLVDNGYTPAEANQLMSETNLLAARLDQQGLRIYVSEKDSFQTISENIRSVMPEASPLFLEFYATKALATR
jgi:hypothetical protein